MTKNDWIVDGSAWALTIAVHLLILLLLFPFRTLHITQKPGDVQYSPIHVWVEEEPQVAAEPKEETHHNEDKGGQEVELPKAIPWVGKPLPQVQEKPQPTAPKAEGKGQGDGLPGDRGVAEVSGSGAPIYPKEALNNEWTGTVVVDIQINKDGVPESVTVVRSSGHPVLDNAFARIVKEKYRFKPKRVMGVDLPSSLRLSYTFALD
ncbi:MAG: energy transducer TonB [Candidatus Margulisiibacteriota bacterium]